MTLVNIRLRHDKAADWSSATVLSEGEVGVETDTGRMKVGDGVRDWGSLAYSDGPLPTSAPPAVGKASVGSSSLAARSDHSHAMPTTASFSELSVTGSQSVFGSLSVKGALIGGSHNHEIVEIEGLTVALSEKAALVHSHDVTSLSKFPSLQGQSGRFLSTDGSNLYWTSASSDAADVTNGTGISVTTDPDGTYRVALADTVVNSVSVVQTSNGTTTNLSGGLTLKAGANVDISLSGSVITVAATGASSSSNVSGVASLNGLSGNVTISAGSGVSIDSSGETISISAVLPQPSNSPGASLANFAGSGTAADYSRADHSHPLPAIHTLPVTAGLDLSGYEVKYTNSYTPSTAPAASVVTGMFAEINGSPNFSDGSAWVELSVAGHGHAIADVSGLSTALESIPSAGDYVATVNGASPDSDGNIQIETGLTSVKWGDVSGRPYQLSAFTNNGNGDAEGGFVTAAGASAAAPVQSVNGETGAVSISLSDISDVSLSSFSLSGAVLSLDNGSWKDSYAGRLIVGDAPAEGWASGTVGARLDAVEQLAETFGRTSNEEPEAPPAVPADDPDPPPESPSAASVLEQPLPAVDPFSGGDISLSFKVSPTPTSYRWQYLIPGSGGDSADSFEDVINDGTASGASTDTLTLVGLDESYVSLRFRCVATMPDGSEVTSSESVIVDPGGFRITGLPDLLTFREAADGSVALVGGERPTVRWVNSPGRFFYRWKVASAIIDDGTGDWTNRGRLWSNSGSAVAADGGITSGTFVFPTFSPTLFTMATYDPSELVRVGYMRLEYTFDNILGGFADAPNYTTFGKEIEVRILSATPRWTQQPAATELELATGDTAPSATFTATSELTRTSIADFSGSLSVEWDRYGLWAEIPSQFFDGSNSSSSSGTTLTAKVYPFGKDGANYDDLSHFTGVNVRFRADVASGQYRSARLTNSAAILRPSAAPARILSLPEAVQSLASDSVALTAIYEPQDAQVAWEVRYRSESGYYGPWQSTLSPSTLLGTSTVTFQALGSDDRAQFRVTASSGAFVDSAVTTLFVNEVSGTTSGENLSSQEPRDAATTSRSSRYITSSVSTLLEDEVPHYAAILVEQDGVTKIYEPANGDAPGAGGELSTFRPLKYFPAGKYSEYSIDIPWPGTDATVGVIVSTDPTQIQVLHYSQSVSDTTIVRASPWAGLTPFYDRTLQNQKVLAHAKAYIGFTDLTYPLESRSGEFSVRTFSQWYLRDGFNPALVPVALDGTQATEAAWLGSAPAVVNYDLLGDAPVGFTLVGRATLRAAQQEVDSYLPNVIGAAYEPSNGTYMAAFGSVGSGDYVCAVRAPGSQTQYMISPDNGETWVVRALGFSASPNSLVFFRGAFYLFYHNGTHFTAARGTPSGTGGNAIVTWNATNWNFSTNWATLTFPESIDRSIGETYTQSHTATANYAGPWPTGDRPALPIQQTGGPMGWGFVQYDNRRYTLRAATRTVSGGRVNTTDGVYTRNYDLALLPSGLSARVINGLLIVSVPTLGAGSPPYSVGEVSWDREWRSGATQYYSSVVPGELQNASAIMCNTYTMGQTGGWAYRLISGSTLAHEITYAHGKYVSGWCQSSDGINWSTLRSPSFPRSVTGVSASWTQTSWVGDGTRAIYTPRGYSYNTGSIGMSPFARIYPTNSPALGGAGMVGYSIAIDGAWTASPASVPLGQAMTALPMSEVGQSVRDALVSGTICNSVTGKTHIISPTSVHVFESGDLATARLKSDAEVDGSGFIREGALTKILYENGSAVAGPGVTAATGTPGMCFNPVATKDGFLYLG
jgi:hypothetical protein